jgi:hypothetical protein
MAALRSVVWPASRLGKWAAGTASASMAGLWVGTVVPERDGWSVIGMAGTAGGLALGLGSGLMALVAIRSRGDVAIGVFAAFMPFAAALYLIRRSLVTSPAS